MKTYKILWMILAVLSLAAAGDFVKAQQRDSGSQRDDGIDIRSEADSNQLLALTRPQRRRPFSLMPGGSAPERNASSNVTPMAAGPTQTVMGGGTLGRLTKWTGFTASSSFIGDTTIFEDKTGRVGIGTDTPASKLTVAGMVEITLGGLKFPDGTIQTTGGLATVIHDATLKGNGTSASPLGIAVPLSLAGPLNSALPVVDIGAGPNSAGTGGLGVATAGGFGMVGGVGVEAFGGVGVTEGGTGVKATGGDSGSSFGGIGLDAIGGNSTSGDAGIALAGRGGDSDSGSGGPGLVVDGGVGRGPGNFGGVGIFATSGSGVDGAVEGLAAFLQGDVEVFAGSLSVKGNFKATGTKMFRIDHPLDPENKYLNHAAIESSEVLNVYSGNITTDQNGDAIVTLPDWFEALNKDFRYQLTVVGTFAQAIVADEIKSNRFAIKTDSPNVKVSWQVTGVRNDRGMRKQPFKVEEVKADRERGHYLQPEAFDQPEEKSIQWARYPERMRQIKEQRIKTEQRLLQKRQPNQR